MENVRTFVVRCCRMHAWEGMHKSADVMLIGELVLSGTH